MNQSACSSLVFSFTPSSIQLSRKSVQLLNSPLHSVNLSSLPGNGSLSRQTMSRTFPVHSKLAASVETSSESLPEIVGIPEPVLVVGASGGVGQLVVAALLERGSKVRALLRSHGKAESLFGNEHKNQLKVVVADLRDPATLTGDILEGVGSVVVCTGTTAFPSKRWDNNNGPEQTDFIGNKNLLAALPPSIKRIVFVSSVGVTRFDSFPYNILNLFGVLKCKKKAEELVEASGIPYTIIRPGRLTDGPYTSYDLNTLLKATSGLRRSAIIEKGDKLTGEASRILVAQACVQSLCLPITVGQIYAINSTEDADVPGTDSNKWNELFTQAK